MKSLLPTRSINLKQEQMQTAEVVAFGKLIKFVQDFGIKNIEKHESQILEYGLEKLRKDNSVKIIGNPKNRASIISFTIKEFTLMT